MILSHKQVNKTNLSNIFSSTLNGIKLCKIIRNDEAINFVKKLISNNYKKILKKSPIDISCVDKSFKILKNGQTKKISISNLKEDINFISKNIYSDKNIPEIFEKYEEYKSFLKPKYYFSLIKKDILGNKILDFGTGKGYMSEFLCERSYNSISADVIDYRETNNKNINFIKINKISDISSKIPSHDTSLLLTVLHHISSNYILDTLKELSKISKRLIIIEDIWDKSFIEMQTKTKTTKEFLKLSEKTKEDSIKLMDFYGNVVTQGLTKMNLPFQFKNVDEWKDILEESGFSVRNIEFIGLPKVSFHGFFQVKIVCDNLNLPTK